MESVRDKAGDIMGFRYRYVNYHAEKLLKSTRAPRCWSGRCANCFLPIAHTNCARNIAMWC